MDLLGHTKSQARDNRVCFPAFSLESLVWSWSIETVGESESRQAGVQSGLSDRDQVGVGEAGEA